MSRKSKNNRKTQHSTGVSPSPSSSSSAHALRDDTAENKEAHCGEKGSSSSEVCEDQHHRASSAVFLSVEEPIKPLATQAVAPEASTQERTREENKEKQMGSSRHSPHMAKNVSTSSSSPPTQLSTVDLKLSGPMRAKYALWCLIHDQIKAQRAQLASASQSDRYVGGFTAALSGGNPENKDTHRTLMGSSSSSFQSPQLFSVSADTLIDLEIESVLRHLEQPETLQLLRRHIVGTPHYSTTLMNEGEEDGDTCGDRDGSHAKSNKTAFVSPSPSSPFSSFPVGFPFSWTFGWPNSNTTKTDNKGHALSARAGQQNDKSAGLQSAGIGSDRRRRGFTRGATLRSTLSLVKGPTVFDEEKRSAVDHLPFIYAAPSSRLLLSSPADKDNDTKDSEEDGDFEWSTAMGFSSRHVRAIGWRNLLVGGAVLDPSPTGHTQIRGACANDDASDERNKDEQVLSNEGAFGPRVPCVSEEEEHAVISPLPSLAFLMRRELMENNFHLLVPDAVPSSSSGGKATFEQHDGGTRVVSPPKIRDEDVRRLLLGSKVTQAFPSFVPEQVIYSDIERSLWSLYPDANERLQRRKELKECLFRVLLAKEEKRVSSVSLSSPSGGAAASTMADDEKSPGIRCHENSGRSAESEEDLYHYYQGLHEVLGHVLYAMQHSVGSDSGSSSEQSSHSSPRWGTSAYEESVLACNEVVRRCFAPMCLPSLLHSEAMLRAMHAIIKAEDPALAKLLERSGLGPSDHFAVSWLLTWFGHEIESLPTLYFVYDLMFALSVSVDDAVESTHRDISTKTEGSAFSFSSFSSVKDRRVAADNIIYWCASVLLLFSGHIKAEYTRIMREEREKRGWGAVGYDHGSGGDAVESNTSDDSIDDDEEDDPMMCFGLLFSLISKLPRKIVASPMAARSYFRDLALQKREERSQGNEDDASDVSPNDLALPPPPSCTPAFNSCFSVIEVFERVCLLRDAYPLEKVISLVHICEHYMIGDKKKSGKGKRTKKSKPSTIEGDLELVLASKSKSKSAAAAVLSRLRALAEGSDDEESDTAVAVASGTTKDVAGSYLPTAEREGTRDDSQLQQRYLRGGMRKAMSATLFGLIVAGYVFSTYSNAHGHGGAALRY